MTSPEETGVPRRTARVLDAVTGDGGLTVGAAPVVPVLPGAPAVPGQRSRRRPADQGRHRALPPPPDLWTPPPGSPACTCGMVLRPQDDACSVCGLHRPSGLFGVLALTGRHWLAGLRRR